jgi:transcriptional regulator with XRE-family HTH domain
MFKKRFDEICAKKGLRPSIVCRSVGISPAAYSQWTDETVPRKNTILRIAQFLEVDQEEFFREDTPADTTDPVDAEIARLFPLLKDEDKADVLRYIEFLRQKNGGK